MKARTRAVRVAPWARTTPAAASAVEAGSETTTATVAIAARMVRCLRIRAEWRFRGGREAIGVGEWVIYFWLLSV
jgi:hypothetical protein